MRNFREFRSRFEGLLTAARKKAGARPGTTSTRTTRLRELTGFGANPGNLRMFAYAPKALPHEAPLVIALHGCTQAAAEYDQGTGWSALADSVGFAVVYPQQQPANNPKNCFSWFLPADIARGHGEALSIRQMVEHAIATFGVDRRKVFVTGLSAGGPWLRSCSQRIRRSLPAGPLLPDFHTAAPATYSRHSRPCSPRMDIPRKRSAIA